MRWRARRTSRPARTRGPTGCRGPERSRQEGGAQPGEAAAVHFSDAEEERMTSFLKGSVSELTHDEYKRFWAMWVSFLAGWRGSNDVALVSNDVALVYLRTDCDRREEKVTEVLSAVRHFLVTVHRQDVGFLSLEIVRKAKLACKRSTDEVRDHQDAQEGNAIPPPSARRLWWP